MRLAILFVTTALLINAQFLACADSPEGFWTGIADIKGDQTRLDLEFVKNDAGLSGRWSLPELGSIRVPFQSLKYDAGTGTLEGDSNFIQAKVTGKTISGQLSWRRIRASFSLEQKPAEPPGYRQEDVSFANGAVKLAGTLILPSQKGPHPAVVFLHGSGTSTRWGALYYADHFARLGFASLIFDKRGSGDSTGDWTESSLDDLARDGLSAIHYLKQRSDIHPGNIGLWGISQAGWVASRLSSMTEDVAFLIIVSGGGVRPIDSEMFAYRTRFSHAGMTEEESSQANALLQQYFDYLKTGDKRTELLASIEANKQAGWYQYVNIGRIVPSEENRPNWNWVASYDPIADIRKMKFPVLLLFGDQDTEQPAPLAMKGWEQGLNEAGNKHWSVKVFSGANHGIRIGSRHGEEDRWPRYAEGYIETQLKWLAARKNQVSGS